MRWTAVKEITMKYIVQLASLGNIDFGQDPRRSLPGVPKRRVRVDSLRAASTACRKYIEDNELGGGNWTGGDVIDAATKTVVAHVSYNGRVWNPGPWPQPEIILEAP
jgi:hypothetical protein